MNTITNTIEAPKTLLDICFPLFALLYKLNYSHDMIDLYNFNAKVIETFLSVEENFKKIEPSEPVWLDVKFAMSTFMDEMILKRNDVLAKEWAINTLQNRFFKENTGGEKFFERLSYLQQFMSKRVDVLEVYYWCLELGYEGKYHGTDPKNVETIQAHLRDLIKTRKQQAKESPYSAKKTRIERKIPIWRSSLMIKTLGICIISVMITRLGYYFLSQYWLQ